MFIKKIVKDDKTYFLWTFCEKVDKGKGKGKNKDTVFHSYFINEDFAQSLTVLGLPIVDKECE